MSTILAIGLAFLFGSAAMGAPLDDFTANKTPEKAFLYLHQVATHPRCANCHGVVKDGMHVPTVGENREPHPMGVSNLLNPTLVIDENIRMQAGNLGTDCLSCHQTTNGSAPGSPPGAANELMPGFLWHMPPAKMIVPLNMSAAELCEKWLNPEFNASAAVPDRGGRHDLEKFRKEFFEHHATEDPLIIWAWSPGKGREPAPGSHEIFLEAMKIWIDGQAPCPSR